MCAMFLLQTFWTGGTLNTVQSIVADIKKTWLLCKTVNGVVSFVSLHLLSIAVSEYQASMHKITSPGVGESDKQPPVISSTSDSNSKLGMGPLRHSVSSDSRSSTPTLIPLTTKRESDNDDDDGKVVLRPLSGSKEYPLRVKVIACLGLVFVQVFAASVMKIAQKDGVYSFSPQSSLVMSETIKTALSALYLFLESRDLNVARASLQDQSSRPLTIHMSGLAALYCFNNAIMFWLFAHADPGSISLIKSGATIVSAVLMYFWRRFRLSVSRWLVIVVQMLGLVVAQYDSCKGRSVLPPSVYGVLFLSLFNSSIANVWNEHVVKNFEFSGLAVKNIYLYAFGAVLNMGAFWYYRAVDPSTPSFFQGYNLVAMLVVTSNAFIGIAMNAVYKYADALVKNVATTTTTVILLVLSAWFFAGRGDLMVFIGASVVVAGTFLYFLLGSSESKTEALQRKLDDLKGSMNDETY